MKNRHNNQQDDYIADPSDVMYFKPVKLQQQSSNKLSCLDHADIYLNSFWLILEEYIPDMLLHRSSR